MNNFIYKNPTKILFGKGQIANIGAEISADAKILLTYGGGSIKQNDVYDQVKNALPGYSITEFGGIEANPEYTTLMRAVEIVKNENIDFLLAVGGGSVVDGTKFIAAAAKFDGADPWDILAKRPALKSALPIGVVLTLPGTGTESNGAAVVSRSETTQKLAFIDPAVFPQFAVLDPETTFSLPPRQIGNGVVDAFVHTVEQYLTYPADAPLQDRFAEGIFRTLIEEGPKTLANPTDYTSRANIVWAATLALNGLIAVGVPQDWATHMIGHELTALYEIDHARTLAVVLPNLLTVKSDRKRAKLLQFAERVWDIRNGSDDERITQGIDKMRDFFEQMGLPTRLSDYSVNGDAPANVVRQLERQGAIRLGEHGDIDSETVHEIIVRAA